MTTEISAVSSRVLGAPVRTRIIGPDEDPPSPDDVRRLFPHMALTMARLRRLGDNSRVIATCDDRIVGIASFERVNRDIRVHDFAIAEEEDHTKADIAARILRSLELACLAGGSHRLVIAPSAAVDPAIFRQLGYATVDEGCAGRWLEKTFAT